MDGPQVARSIRPRAAVVAAMCAGALLLGACSTLSSDLADIRDTLLPPSPREAAEDMLDQYDPGARWRGTTLIANSPFGGADVYVKAYADMVENDPDPIARAAATRALGRHGSVEHAALIARQLEHESFQVRWEAAKALQRIHDPGVIDALLRTIRKVDEQRDVRVAVARALGQYPEDRVFQQLVSALGARELSLNLAAAESLGTLTGQSFGVDARAWLTWYRSTREPFAGRDEYLYPTYSRGETFLEKLVFWSKPTFEQPAPPAGLRPRGQRSTYEDADTPAGDGADG